MLPDTASNLPALIKNEMLYGPCAIAIQAKEDFFYYLGGTYTPIMGDNLTDDGSPKLNHGICLCGWKDGTSEWIFKNSWGPSWGENGYGYFPYGGEGGEQGPSNITWMTPEGSGAYKIILESSQMIEPNNGIWDPSEQVSLITTLKAKDLNFTDVQGTLTENDTDIAINMGSYNFGNIPDDSTANNSSNPFKATASATCPRKTVTFNLHVTSPESTYATDLTFTVDVGLVPCGEIDNFANPCNFPYAMAFDGTYLWVTCWGNVIYKLDMSGSQVSTIPTPENDTCTGIAWDAENNRLWVHANTKKKIYKVDPSNGSVDTSFASPASFPTGLAYDGTYLYAVDRPATGGTIYKLTTSGSVVTSFSVPIQCNYGPRGLSFLPHPLAPDSGSLILYITHWTSGSSPSLDSTCIYEIERSDGSYTGKTCKTNTGANGRLVCVDPIRGYYWVDGGQNGPIARIKGFYPPIVGVEENIHHPWISDLTILPNPSWHEATISFYVPEPSKVSICIYDITGKLVYHVPDNVFHAGNHRIVWSGNNLSNKRVPSGVYFCRLETSHCTTAEKFVILR